MSHNPEPPSCYATVLHDTFVASEPVPAVVGTAIIGMANVTTVGNFSWFSGRESTACAAIAFAVSIEEPPPYPTRQSIGAPGAERSACEAARVR